MLRPQSKGWTAARAGRGPGLLALLCSALQLAQFADQCGQRGFVFNSGGGRHGYALHQHGRHEYGCFEQNIELFILILGHEAAKGNDPADTRHLVQIGLDSGRFPDVIGDDLNGVGRRFSGR